MTQLSTGANSHYNGLQLTAESAPDTAWQGQVNYTLSRCLDEVSNGGFLPFSAGGILSPLPGELIAELWSLRLRHPRITSQASMCTTCRLKCRSRRLGTC